MRKLVLLCAMVFVVMAGPAHAQNILWVASNGSDANSCTQTAPCATFAGAIQKGGVAQINCLSSGSYGVLNSTTVSISGSITIDCGTGNVGNIFSNGTAISIDASSAVTVVLRHLSLNGLGTAANGITTPGFPSGSLTVEDCTIQGNVGAGISFIPSSGRGLLQVSDSQVINNAFGITVQPVNGQIASVTLNRVEVAGNAVDGLSLIGPGVVAGTMRDSLVASNGADGVQASANQVFFTVEESSIIANLSSGIHTTSAGSNLTVTASTIGANGTGIKATAGSIVSFGNNSLNGNGSDGAFTSTISLK
jgi:Right handed beta helix region